MAPPQTDVAERTRGERTAIRQPSSSELRRSAAIRIAVAIFVSGALTVAAVAAIWARHPAKSDVIGYPIISDFNPNNYVHAYYLVGGLFPTLALLIFLALTRIGPRIGLATPAPRGPLRPVATAGEADAWSGAEPSSPVHSRVAAAARVAGVGAVLGLQVGVASGHPLRSIALVGVGYSLLLGLGAVALRGVLFRRSSWEIRLAALNSLGAPLAVAGLSLVSAHTEVQVVRNHTVHHYPWFPAWLGVPVAAALLAWIVAALRRAGPARAGTIERRAAMLIAAPVALFVLVATLPGDLGTIDLYEQGQFLTAARLVGHGWLPWRDVFVVHGVLRDVLPTAVGWDLFGNSMWGSIAGMTLIFLPLTIVATYWLLAYLVGRSWPLLLIGMSIFLGTWFATADARYLLWPLILLLMAASLRRPTRVRAAALGVSIVVQAIVTPEMAAAVPIVAVVVAAYELYWRAPGAPFPQAFRRTISLTIGAVVCTAAFSIYMASRGALGDVISVTMDSFAAKFNQGIPPTPGFSSPQFDVIALAPVAAVLISFAYAVARLRLRRPFWLADWPMAAAALFVLFYYTKFLTVMEIDHAYEPFEMATPLMLYIIYRAVTAIEGWIRARVSERHSHWVTAHPVGVALLIVLLAFFWGPLRTTVENVANAYRPPVPDPPVTRVGYAAQLDGPAVADLRRIINAYLGPHDRLLDMTNEPALFFYFLGRDPSSRWIAPVSVLSTPQLQDNLLATLRRRPPKLIILDDTDTKMYGLSNLEGVPAPAYLYLVSRWVLEHYRPLVESHGRTIYALPGLRPFSSLHLRLDQAPVTAGVAFQTQECTWGDSPTFLTGPAEPTAGARSVGARASEITSSDFVLDGWAGDPRTAKPAREIIATFHGRIVARSTPSIERPDVPAAGHPAGFLNSGFHLSIPRPDTPSAGLRVYGVAQDGSMTGLAGVAGLNLVVATGTARVGNHIVRLRPRAVVGGLDSETPTHPRWRIEPPRGSTWSDYRWLEVDAPRSGFRQGSFTLSDQASFGDPEHAISFDTLVRSPRRYVIPVSSCAQWHGYSSSPLYLMSSPNQVITGVGLIR